MAYPTLPGRRIPYHNDGSALKVLDTGSGVIKHFSDSEMAELNDYDYTTVTVSGDDSKKYLVVFFPEARNIKGLFCQRDTSWGDNQAPTSIQGSNDTTNGLDGTWTSLTMPDGFNNQTQNFDSWRKGGSGGEGWQHVDDGGVAYSSIRLGFATGSYNDMPRMHIFHIYGSKGTGETADDILFVDPDNADAEFALPINVGPVPAGTSVIDKFALKNSSASLTANNIDLIVDDPQDIVRISDSSGGPWNISMNLASLAAGAQSATYYVKVEAPAPPTALEPKSRPINITVGSWS